MNLQNQLVVCYSKTKLICDGYIIPANATAKLYKFSKVVQQ